MSTNINEFLARSQRSGTGEIGARTDRRQDFFRRELVQQEDRCLIKSTCRRCGLVIVGSIADMLVADEQRHLEQCSAGEAFPAAG